MLQLGANGQQEEQDSDQGSTNTNDEQDKVRPFLLQRPWSCFPAADIWVSVSEDAGLGYVERSERVAKPSLHA